MMPLKQVLRSTVWVVAFLIILGGFYRHAVHKKKEVMAGLRDRLHLLQEEKRACLLQNEDLMLQIDSQSDPAWVELTLMKGLGLVPEGQLKVYFTPTEAIPFPLE